MKVIANLIIFITILFSGFQADVRALDIQTELIAEYKKDVTGDGVFETIKLYGERFSPDSLYYRDIYALIASNTDKWRISYQGGYNPVLDFYDFNHDGADELFFQSEQRAEASVNKSQLESLYNRKIKKLSLPEHKYIKGYFEDEFQAVIEIAPNVKPLVHDIEDKKEDYLSHGMYARSGKYIGTNEVIIDKTGFYEPVFISDSKGYGLKSFNQINGLSQKDKLGILETTWYFEDDKWIVLHIQWNSSQASDVK